MKIPSGSFLINLLFMACCGAIGAFVLKSITVDIIDNKIVPWAIISFSLVPVPIIYSSLQNSKELLEIESITKSEFNRLKTMVSNNSLFLKLTLFLALISAIAIGIALYFLGVGKLMPVDVFTLIGGLFGAEIYVIYYLLAMRENIQNFRTKVIRRMNDLKQKRNTIKRLEKTKSRS